MPLRLVADQLFGFTPFVGYTVCDSFHVGIQSRCFNKSCEGLGDDYQSVMAGVCFKSALCVRVISSWLRSVVITAHCKYFTWNYKYFTWNSTLNKKPSRSPFSEETKKKKLSLVHSHNILWGNLHWKKLTKMIYFLHKLTFFHCAHKVVFKHVIYLEISAI